MKLFPNLFTKILTKYPIITKITGIIAATIILYLAIYYSYPSTDIEGFIPSVKAEVKQQIDTYQVRNEESCRIIIDLYRLPEKPKEGVYPQGISASVYESIIKPIILDESIKTNENKVDAIFIKLKNVYNIGVAEKRLLDNITLNYIVRYATTMLMLDVLNKFKMGDKFPEDTAFITLLNDKTNAIISIVAGKESVYNTLNNYMLEDTSEDQV